MIMIKVNDDSINDPQRDMGRSSCGDERQLDRKKTVIANAKAFQTDERHDPRKDNM